MSTYNIDNILGNIGPKYSQTSYVDGMQDDPQEKKVTNFKQEYTVIIRKKKYYAITALQGNDAYIRMYQIDNFSTISTNISTSGQPGNCNISITGNTKIICAERNQQDSAGYGSGEVGFNNMMKEWAEDIEDHGNELDANGNLLYNNILFNNVDDMKKMKYGWKVAEKCDWEPMDEVYVFAKSRHIKENGKYKVFQIFFGYISSVNKTNSFSSATVPIITIQAADHLKLLQISEIESTAALDYNTTFASAHYEKDSIGNIIIDDKASGDGLEEKPSMFTNIFAGRYPYEIVLKCCRDAGIPDKFLTNRIERITRIPFMPYTKKGGIAETFNSELATRLSYCQQAAEKLFLEFFADEEGNIVLKIPNYSIGMNKLSANKYYLDKILSDSEQKAIENAGMQEQTVTNTVTTYKSVNTGTITHTVVSGDTLWDLAKTYLGDATKWPEIYEINKGQVKYPHWIYPGQVLYINKSGSTTSVPTTTTTTTKQLVDGGSLSAITDKYIRVIEDDEIISFTLTDSDDQICNMVEIQPEIPLVDASQDSSYDITKRAVEDWQSIIQFGFRNAQTFSTPLLDKDIGPTMFGTLMIQRSLAQRYKGTLTIIEESSIRVGDPIRVFLYDEHPFTFTGDNNTYGKQQAIFYVDSIQRSISVEGVSTMTLSLSAGRVVGMQSIYDKMSILYNKYYTVPDIVPYTPPTSSSGGGGSYAGGTVVQNNIVNFAKSFLGVPYVYGGTSPSGFDCSGFVQYVYKHYGYNIDRTSEQQIHDGHSVDRNSLQPGDLVFFEPRSDGPGHVGMYIGGGQMIHAPHTGDVVKIASFDGVASADGYAGAVRII